MFACALLWSQRKKGLTAQCPVLSCPRSACCTELRCLLESIGIASRGEVGTEWQRTCQASHLNPCFCVHRSHGCISRKHVAEVQRGTDYTYSGTRPRLRVWLSASSYADELWDTASTDSQNSWWINSPFSLFHRGNGSNLGAWIATILWCKHVRMDVV
jgi:hypothetical protein